MVVGDGWGCGLEVGGGGVISSCVPQSRNSLQWRNPRFLAEPTKAAIAYRSFRAVTVRFPLIHIIIRSWQNRPQISDSASVVTFLQRRQQISEY